MSEQEEGKPHVGLWGRLFAAVASLGAAKEIVVEDATETLTIEKDFVARILPHRGPALLLDRVVITPQKVVGFFTVTLEVCAGHEIGGTAVFRAVYLPEMANQLLGVWFASQHPELIGAGRILFASSGSYKAIKFIQAGETIAMEVDYADLMGDVRTRHQGTLTKVTGKRYSAMVNGELRGIVDCVELKGFDSPKTTPPVKPDITT